MASDSTATAETGSRLRICIVMADSNAWRQPMVFGLIQFLSSRFQVELLSLRDHAQQVFVLPECDTVMLERRAGISMLEWAAIRFAIIVQRCLQALLPQCRFAPRAPDVSAMTRLMFALRKRKATDHVIAIDCVAALAAQLAGRSPSLLLLEMLQNNLCHLALRDSRLHCVVTQSRLRYLAAFPKGNLPFVFVPNFPAYRERSNRKEKKGFVFAGTALPGFGAIRCLDFALRFPDVSLNFHGAAPPYLRNLLSNPQYEELQRSGRVTVNDTFQQEEDYLSALSGYQLGFAFYDLEEADKCFFSPGVGIEPFSVQNYLLGAAGKIGSCCAAGVPVIASNLPGLSFVQDYGAGVLVNRMDPQSIREAALEIESRYEEFSANCIKLAREYCLNKHLENFAKMITRSA